MSDTRPTIPVTLLGQDDVAGICEIDPVTGLMVCDLPSATEIKTKTKTDAAPTKAAGRPTGDKK